MPDNFYRSGQAAKQLGVSSYHVRRLCEVGEITAELTGGQQWRIPASEIARLRRDGIPDVPVESEDGDDHSAGAFPDPDADEPRGGLLAAPSVELIEAAEEVKVVENRLKKRRIEKESEELEDWFRGRERQQAEREAGERQKAEAAQAAQRRRHWFDSWMQYALRSRPYDAPQEIELEIHEAMQSALARFDPDQPRSTTQRLVDAAVQKVLRPWRLRKEIRSAIESAMNRLPWDINNRPEWASVKQEAMEAAMTAAAKMRAEATSKEMQEVAWLAVQPTARTYAQWKTCQDMAASVFLLGGSYEETKQARDAVGEALSRLPVGTSQGLLEKTSEETLRPFRATIQKRKAEAEEREDQARRRAAAERRVDWRLLRHFGECIRELEEKKEIEFDSASDRWELEQGLKKRIRPMMLSEVAEEQEMSDQDIDQLMEELVDKHIEEFLDD
jgi:excisionase family DNA binding protein